MEHIAYHTSNCHSTIRNTSNELLLCHDEVVSEDLSSEYPVAWFRMIILLLKRCKDRLLALSIRQLYTQVQIKPGRPPGVAYGNDTSFLR